MTSPTLTYKTSDGREFNDQDDAEQHQALLNRITSFLDANDIGASRRKRLTQMFVDWTELERIQGREGVGA